ncbi:hypothetical protein I3842_05G068200 [Carya illinoinensis]|uniref:Uncharacterized protein n=1 Tax=Carya illinoinensis TaxID=32201 RepID=A0A922F0N6_CARIL|nr:hypothetical protein I3842_05G068200 [Carya illinoinensis]
MAPTLTSLIGTILLHEKKSLITEHKLRPQMGLLILLKKSSLLFLILASVLLSTCLAVRQSMPVSELPKEGDALLNEGIPHEDLDIISVHERLLRANTKDYGKYDPAPALVKPPFKLIPN